MTTTDARYGGWDFTIPGEAPPPTPAPTKIEITGGGVEMPKGFTMAPDSRELALERVPTPVLVQSMVRMQALGGESLIQADGMLASGGDLQVRTSAKNAAFMTATLRELARRHVFLDDDDFGVYPTPPADSGDR